MGQMEKSSCLSILLRSEQVREGILLALTVETRPHKSSSGSRHILRTYPWQKFLLLSFIIKSSLQILEDIQNTQAATLEDLQSEVATDIYQTCLMMRRRVARIVQAKSFLNVDMRGVTELLDIIDYIDSKLEGYKKKYLKLKQRAIRDIEKKRSKLEKKQEEAQQEVQKVEKVAEKVVKRKKEKQQQQVKEEIPQIVDLLDLGQGQPQAMPGAGIATSQQEEQKDSSSEDERPKEEEKKSGFKKLMAPPTSKLHVLENMRNLKSKLQAAQPAVQSTNTVMDMLIDLDIKSDETQIQQQQHQPQMMMMASGSTPQQESVDFFANLAHR